MGFVDFSFSHRMPFGVEDCAEFPLFTPQLIALMRRLIPSEQQSCVATSVIVRARRP